MRIGKSILHPLWGDIIISSHKSFEYQFDFGSSVPQHSLFHLSFQITRKVDHSGPRFNFGIHRLFHISLGIYDHRHWNHKENRWVKPGDYDDCGGCTEDTLLSSDIQ